MTFRRERRNEMTIDVSVDELRVIIRALQEHAITRDKHGVSREEAEALILKLQGAEQSQEDQASS